MSRRAAPPDRKEQNRATLKQLVKLEGNKTCADCKRNKHPRWTSWNLGIFVCIRCSGIHRGMGTHISRVKSIDLDSWTDEHLGSMLTWGNSRANRYWEAKLAPGHVPSEAKIENFIKTKYDSKRWVMDGGMPDPGTLDAEGDDDVPLNVVQEKAKLDRSASLRNGSGSGAPAPLPPPPRVRPQDVDLFGDDSSPVPARSDATESAMASRLGPVKAPVASPRQTRLGESLLGLDFFGGTQSAPPAQPTSAQSGLASTSGVPGRTDLKQSILSLYSSAPRQAPPQQKQQPQSNANLFSAMQSPTFASPTQQPQHSRASLGDAFGSLSFSPPTQTQVPQPKPGAVAKLASPISHNNTSSFGGGGSFFDSKPAPPPQPTSPPLQKTQRTISNDFRDLGGFSTASPPVAAPATKPAPPATSTMGDLFALFPTPTSSAPPPKPAAAPSNPPPISASTYTNANAFNLSQPVSPPVQQSVPKQTQSTSFATMSNTDVWGSNDAWATPDPTPARAPTQAAPTQTSNTSSFAAPPAPPQVTNSAYNAGWGAPTPSTAQPSVTQDDDFGGWSSASPVVTTSGPKQGGLGGNQDDLFGNVWG